VDLTGVHARLRGLPTGTCDHIKDSTACSDFNLVGICFRASLPADRALRLARGLDLRVLAEGVETNDQLAFLAAERCDEVQGYFIGRPRPIADYAEMTGQHKPRIKAARAL
jgi:c-di-GMP-related signal transduction protein